MTDPVKLRDPDVGGPVELAPPVRWIVLAISLVNGVVGLRWLLWFLTSADRGLDFTDEGYYVSAVTFPWSIPHGPTDFAFLLRPLWILSGRNLAVFRVAGLAMTLACAFALGAVVAGRFDVRTRIDKVLIMSLCVGATCVASFTTVDIGLRTPNYNTLSAGLVMAFLAAAIARFTDPPARVANGRSQERMGQSVLAAAGFTAYLLVIVKLTAGLMAGALLVALIATRVREGERWRNLARPTAWGAVAGLVTHAILVEGRLLARGRAWKDAIDLSELRASHPTDRLWQWDYLTEHRLALIVQLLAAAAVVVVLRRLRSRFGAAEAVGSVALVAVGVVLLFDLPTGGQTGLNIDYGVWWLQFTVAITIVSLASSSLPRRTAVGCLAILVLVLGSAFGSGNGFIAQTHFFVGALVGGALLAAAHVRLDALPALQLVRLVPALACALIVPIVVNGSMTDGRDEPYRLPAPLSEVDQRVETGSLGTLRVHAGIADLVAWAAAISSEWDEEPICIVNLQGASPVIEVLLGVRPAGSNWDLGHYPGSYEAASAALDRDDCWKAAPFLLVSSPDGARRIEIPPEVARRCEPPRWTLDVTTATGSQTLLASECPVR